jgi:hypothetical protein
MSKVNSGWTVVDAKLPLLTYLYSFGNGLATALAVGGPKGLLVVSAPAGVPEAAFTELEKHGKVVALVAPNAFHHMGIPVWKARYPDAAVFAPAQSIARVTKKSGVAGIRPLAESGEFTGVDVDLVDMPHYKTGEVLVRARSGAEVFWYVTDVIMNMPKAPPGFFGLIFKWTGSAPGLRPNGVAPLMMVKDKRALYRWLREQAEKAPPTQLIACHGDPAKLTAPAKELLAILPA